MVIFFFVCFISRHKLDQANAKLRKVLIEMIRSTVATEELIGQKICSRAKSSEIQSVNIQDSAAGLFLISTENTFLPLRSLLFT